MNFAEDEELRAMIKEFDLVRENPSMLSYALTPDTKYTLVRLYKYVFNFLDLPLNLRRTMTA